MPNIARTYNGVPIFTGAVELPTLTPGSGLLRLRCSDGRQGMIDALNAEALNALCEAAPLTSLLYGFKFQHLLC